MIRVTGCCSWLLLGGDGPHDSPDPAGVAEPGGKELEDGSLEDSWLFALIFLSEADVGGEPESEEES